MSAGGNAGAPVGDWAPNPKPAVAEVMSAYDALPPPVRKAIACAVFDWDAPRILRELQSGNCTPAQILAIIENAEHGKR